LLTRFVGPFVLTVLTIASGRAYGQEGRTFSMPQSVLLFDSPDYELRVITGNSIQVFRPPAKQGPFYLPALSSDGARLAWGVPIGVTPKGERGHFVLGVSPTAQQQWKTYGDFEEVGSAAFSPDGSRVAFTAVETGGGRVFLILNLASGELEALRQLSAVAVQAKLGWSPDGMRLVVEVQRSEKTPAISVVDLTTHDMKAIGEGENPSWSPTGEWIAYFDAKGEKCTVAHPDGTNARVVRDLDRNVLQYRMFVHGAVWSPDGTQLLLNEVKGEGPKVDVMLLDLASGKVTRKSKDGLPVFGWVAERR